MKPLASFTVAVVLSSAGLAFAQSSSMKDMPMDSKSHGNMKDMPMDSKSHGDMKGMEMGKTDPKAAKKGEKHTTSATVKNADPAKGKVTLAHEPVKSLKWPAMTMGFSVKDKKLFDKLNPGEKVQVEFVQQGSEYVVTSVK